MLAFNNRKCRGPARVKKLRNLESLERRDLMTGDLDLGFGLGLGFTQSDFDDSNDAVADIVVQQDGKIVAGGLTNVDGENDFALARYHSDGTLDTTFGGYGAAPNGMVATDISQSDDRIFAIHVQDDGKILAMGNMTEGQTNVSGSVVRYLPDGSLDPDFGDLGKVSVISPFSVGGEIFVSDERVIVISRSGMWRFQMDGTPDQDFGYEGITNWYLPTGKFLPDDFRIHDGKIYSAGTHSNDEGIVQTAFTRWNLDGNLDPTFGDGGVMDVSDVGGGLVNDFVVDSNEKIVATGSGLVFRLLPNGDLDNSLASFNGDGVFELPPGVVLTQLIQQPGGLIAGVGYTSSDGSNKLTALRFGPDGVPDESFGADGLVEYDLLGADTTQTTSAFGFANGKILVGGFMKDVSFAPFDFLLARIDGSPPEPSIDPHDGGGLVVPGSGGSDHMRVHQMGELTTVEYVGWEDAKYSFENVRTVGINGGRGDDFIEHTVHMDSLGWRNSKVKIRGGTGDDIVIANQHGDLQNHYRYVLDIRGGSGDDAIEVNVDDAGINGNAHVRVYGEFGRTSRGRNRRTGSNDHIQVNLRDSVIAGSIDIRVFAGRGSDVVSVSTENLLLDRTAARGAGRGRSSWTKPNLNVHLDGRSGEDRVDSVFRLATGSVGSIHLNRDGNDDDDMDSPDCIIWDIDSASGRVDGIDEIVLDIAQPG